ncbi:unnamed protein product, partial [Cladocopium goreaui]
VAIVFTSGNMIGPMFVGMTAQHLFHYKLNSEGIENMPTEVRLHNAEALGKSLCITSTIPCTISAIIFSTYLGNLGLGPDEIHGLRLL